jgi:hypothetical protein
LELSDFKGLEYDKYISNFIIDFEMLVFLSNNPTVAEHVSYLPASFYASSVHKDFKMTLEMSSFLADKHPLSHRLMLIPIHNSSHWFGAAVLHEVQNERYLYKHLKLIDSFTNFLISFINFLVT